MNHVHRFHCEFLKSIKATHHYYQSAKHCTCLTSVVVVVVEPFLQIDTFDSNVTTCLEVLAAPLGLACIWRSAHAAAQRNLRVACWLRFPFSCLWVSSSVHFHSHCIALNLRGWALLCRWMLQENTPGVSHNQFPACLADFCHASREASRLIGRRSAETPPSRHAVTLWFMGLFLSPFRFNGQYRQDAFSNIRSRSRATAPFCLPPRPFDRFPFPPLRSPSIYAAMHDGVRMRTRQRAAPEPSHQIRRWPFTFPWRVFARPVGQTSAPLRDVVPSRALLLTGSQMI